MFARLYLISRVWSDGAERAADVVGHRRLWKHLTPFCNLLKVAILLLRTIPGELGEHQACLLIPFDKIVHNMSKG